MPNFVFVIAVTTITLASVNAMMTGGVMDQDPKDPEWMAKAWKAAKSLNEDASNAGQYVMIPVKVLKAQTQVVAGTKYIFEIVFGESECKKGEVDLSSLSSANCQLKANGSRALYQITLWEKPWQNFEQFNVEKIRDVDAGEQL
ncbi:cystatin domain protein [Ancylostoma caninum]|uniref:Cystatin domain protein n=1 Tax=Ancylostoma caninum TaxID=29170 RepID=A0A368HC31_ANCCA|nr:cystatin domain protein [Ancylostoma caninum]